MKKLTTYDEYLDLVLEAKVIEFLHEGTQVLEVKALNEGLVDYANAELDELLNSMKAKGETAIITEFIPEIKALVKKFADSGQSGCSAPYTAGAITKTLEKLFMFKPLTPIMNEDSEWNETNFLGGPKYYQNRKLGSVFKESKDSKPYYLDAIVFKGKNSSFTGAVALEEEGEDKISSSQYIKSFPFEPKTFVIDVEEKEFKKMPDGSFVEEQGGGWWESWIKDPKQLDEVWKYYDKKEIKKKK